ncbi:MAG: hypothetical protein GKC04_02020 [Methanomicrobiales archaeon]|nr:hypothetical protein [Methanomicrobiales archaeon]
MKQSDEIMAEYLLKGGKMLSATCPACGSPLFDVKGETLCVVCLEQRGDAPGQQAGKEAAGAEPAPSAPGQSAGGIAAALDATLLALCERAAREQRPEDCLTLMECIRKGVEARNLL